jgi:hypothetical protein
MVYAFARIGAALKMGLRTFTCKSAEAGYASMRCPAITISKPTFTLYRECGIGGNPKNVLFPTAQGRTGKLSDRPMTQADESARATGLYDRRDDEISLDEVERIGI